MAIMESSNGNLAKIIIAFVVGFVFGFGVSQTILGDGNALNNLPDNDQDATDVTDKSGNNLQGGLEQADNTTPDKATQGLETDGIGINAPKGSVTIGASAISIESQLAGPTVIINRLVLDERSWVVIYEDSRGRPGNALGARRFTEGVHSNVKIELLRGTEGGGAYYGMIHGDSGDDDFSLSQDLPLTDESGSPIMVRFNTTR